MRREVKIEAKVSKNGSKSRNDEAKVEMMK
jgi:hypothetical protein